MRCTAITKHGTQCKKPAGDGGPLCKFHTAFERHRQDRAFYMQRQWQEDDDALAAVALVQGLDQEIAMLRLLMRSAAARWDLDAFRLGMDLLVKALKVKHELDQAAPTPRDSALQQLLDHWVLPEEEGEDEYP